ncbi:hypothetical protein MTO96_013952 [Rhipicephalus appendiculatus]
MDGSSFPGLARTLLLLLMAITLLPDRTCVVTTAKPPLLCEMSREMKLHLLECARTILQEHVVTLLAKRSKRFFKGRELVDAITDMCVEASHIINNNEVDKNYTEYALWNCMNTTRYVMLYGDS